MKYIDRIYGEFEITEPVVLELINSPSLQRLKHIDQAGYKPLWAKPNVVVPDYDYSRFAHSVGVYLLLHKYGAPLAEQISGLIHDVSHSAFSHCADYILKEGSGKVQNHQDNIHDSFVKNSEIPAILERYGYKTSYILNNKNFPLEENDLPDICADRIDYSLRSAVVFGEISMDKCTDILKNLVTEGDKWVFNNYESAREFADLFLNLNTIYYCGIESAIMFRAVGDCLKYSLENKYITREDLYTTDDEVIERVKGHVDADEKLSILWQRMNGTIKATDNVDDFEAEVYCKSRVIDPLFRQGGLLVRVSEKDPNWLLVLEKESKPKHYFLKFDK